MTDGNALQQLRQQIDHLDEQIASLLQKRAELSLAVGKIKGNGANMPILVPDREARVLAHVQSINGPLDAAALASIYREILATSRALQGPLRVAHLGPAGTFAHQAAREWFGNDAALQACATNVDVFTAVEKGAAHYGMVPFENSTEGLVIDVLDRFVDTPLQVCAEYVIPVSLAVLSRATSLSDVRRVISHPQPIGQCRGWLAEHLPGRPLETASSTARSSELAAEDPTAAAIAPRIAADVYGLNVLAENVQDLAANVTRFLVLAHSPSETPTGRDRTAVVFSIRDRVGALRDLTDAFASNEVNLSSIQSRPSKRRMWDYLFFVELEGHVSDPPVQRALEMAKEHAAFLKVLGSWPIAV